MPRAFRASAMVRALGSRSRTQSRSLKSPVHAGAPNPELRSNLRDTTALLKELYGVPRLGSRCRLAPLVAPCGLGFCDAFTLTLLHDLQLELREGSEHVEYETTRSASGVHWPAAEI
jgi:hypothetical protein